MFSFRRARGAALIALTLTAAGCGGAIAGPLDLARGATDVAFDGLYIAADVGRQDLVGGALIGGVDLLEQRQRFAGNLALGYRKQFGRFVFGAEGGYGVVDGRLSVSDPGLQIEARNGTQSFYGLQAGYVANRNRDLMAFAYLSEVSRTFNLDIVSMGAAFSQRDEQGMLRFGAGIERRVAGGLHARITAGTARGKFDSAIMKPSRHVEFAAGLVIQF